MDGYDPKRMKSMKQQQGHRRLFVDLPVYIRYGKRPFHGGRVSEFAEDGLTIEIRALRLRLPVGTPVELELSALGESWRVSAIVTDDDPDSIGLMFCETQDALYSGLLEQSRSLRGKPPVRTGRADGAPMGNRFTS